MDAIIQFLKILWQIILEQFEKKIPIPEPEPEPEPEPIPEPVPSPSGGIEYPTVVNDDIQYGILFPKPRDVLPGRYAPDTIPLEDRPSADGKKGAGIFVFPNAVAYIRAINDAKGGHYACDTVGAMWINKDFDADDPNAVRLAESISCGGNFIAWEKGDEQMGAVRLLSFPNTQDWSIFDPAKLNWFTRPELFFKAGSINAAGDRRKVGDDIDCYIPLMNRKSNNGTGELWIGKKYFEPFPALPVTVTIMPDAPGVNVNIRKSFDVTSESIGKYVSGEVVTIYEYRPRGGNVWGRTDKGWICLLYSSSIGRSFLSSWKLETEGVIPPG